MDETDQHFLGTALPLDDVDSADVDLVGRLAEYVARVREVTDRCTVPQPLAAWVQLFREALELLTAVTQDQSWQVGHAHGELSRLVETAGEDAGAVLSLADVTALLADAFRGRPGRSNFRTGTLTMCTMHPMRSIPHRVVCLLGVDDGLFPRRAQLDGDDIAATHPRVGDPDPRSEDRQLMLDAVLAAEEHLVVVFAGMDARSGTDVPPAVPVKELLDTLDETATTGTGQSTSEAVTVRHPLQPFDPANFGADEHSSAPAGAFSFDRAALRGARATRGSRSAPPRVYDRTPLLPIAADAPVELAELVRFFRQPVRALLKARAGVSLFEEEAAPTPQIPVDLDPLQRWEVGERLLTMHLQGQELETLQAAEWRRGTLPPQAFGGRVLQEVGVKVAEVAAAASPFVAAPASKVELDTEVAGRPLVGTVTGVHGDDLVQVSYAKLSARHRLTAWIQLLALAAGQPGRPWRAVNVTTRGVAVLGPVEPAWARRWLAGLVELADLGLREPLPFAARTSALYAEYRRTGQPLTRPQWTSLARQWERDVDPSYLCFYGPDPDQPGRTGLDLLLAEEHRPGEELGGLAEDTRFGTLARRVFEPLLWVEDRS